MFTGIDGRERIGRNSFTRRIIIAVEVLGALRRQSGDYLRAEALLREARTGFVTARPEFWARYEIESTLGASLVAQRKFAEAEPFLIAGYEGLARLANTIPPVNKSSLAQAGDWIVELYRSWGRPTTEAEWRQKLSQR